MFHCNEALIHYGETKLFLVFKHNFWSENEIK